MGGVLSPEERKILGVNGGFCLALVTRNVIRTLSSITVDGSPWMYVAVVLFFFMVTLMAEYMPVRRTILLEPASALRCVEAYWERKR